MPLIEIFLRLLSIFYIFTTRKNMKKIIFILLSFIITNSVFSTETKTYFRADYGLGKFTSEKLDSLNANPTGNTYGIGFGARMSYVEMGFFFKQFNYKVDITHDGAANEIIHEGKSFGIDMNIFLNNYLSLKLGYAFNNYTQEVNLPVNSITLTAIKKAYGLEEDRNTSNIFYGANIDLFGSKRWDISASVLHFPMGSGKSSTSASLGLRLYMDSKFADFFGAN